MNTDSPAIEKGFLLGFTYPIMKAILNINRFFKVTVHVHAHFLTVGYC